MERSEKDRAKQVVLEIVRRSGGTLRNKTNLFKAFWKAHVEYVRDNPGMLSEWPIVRMPNGPGIHDCDSLLAEMIEDHLLEIEQEQSGPYSAFVFRVPTNRLAEASPLPPEALSAIDAGVDYVRGRTAVEVSDASHVDSPSWVEARDGEELNIYGDTLPPEEYREMRREIRELAAATRSRHIAQRQ